MSYHHTFCLSFYQTPSSTLLLSPQRLPYVLRKSWNISVKSSILIHQLPVFLAMTESKLPSKETGSSLLKVILTFFSPHYSPHGLKLYWFFSTPHTISIILLLPTTSKYTIGLKSFFMTSTSMKKIQPTPWCLCSSHLITSEGLFLHPSLVFPRHSQPNISTPSQKRAFQVSYSLNSTS